MYEEEKILLDFCPLKESKEPNWNPVPYEWHCYYKILRIYRQDYEFLLRYFNKIYPTKDAFDGTPELIFDCCFDNWIGKDDWEIIICDIKNSYGNHKKDEQVFLQRFILWLEEALKYTNIIVVEGNL